MYIDISVCMFILILAEVGMLDILVHEFLYQYYINNLSITWTLSPNHVLPPPLFYPLNHQVCVAAQHRAHDAAGLHSVI